MPRDGTITKDKIYDAAKALFLDRGIAATSVERISETAGVTKGSFFYHFQDKNQLVLDLVKRFAESDRAQYDKVIKRVDTLGATDPLQRLLLFVGVFIEEFSDLNDPPACLYASYLYEQGIVSEETMAVTKEAFLFWRKKISKLIKEAEKAHPPKEKLDSASLADFFNTTIEGAFIVGQILDDSKIAANHLKHYQEYLELLFSRD